MEKLLLNEIIAQQAAMASAPPRLRALRQNAMRSFSQTGLPTRKDEAWRWTDLSPLGVVQVAQASTLPAAPSTADGPFVTLDTHRIVCVNGAFRADLSASDLPAGVRTISLRAALQADPALADRLCDDADAPFLTLNTALLNDGVFVHVASNAQLEKALHVIFFNTGSSQIRNLMVLEPHASATLLESHYGPADTDYFVNLASDVHLAEGARLAHYRDQAESGRALHFHYLNARLAAHSVYDGFTLTRGARLSRNESAIGIIGEGAECNLNGASMLNGAQLADVTTVMRHAAPASRSAQSFRSVLDDTAQGVFQGLIRVAKPAQRSDAKQQIKALLLSPHAVQNAKPELEILADDVKCAHGASVGQLDEAALFYLRARGIHEAEARALLIAAFLDGAVAQIQGGAGLAAEDIQQRLQAAISEWLARQLAVENV